MIDYDSFQTEQVTVELRYPAAISLWDEAGRIWTLLSGELPELKLNTTGPNQQIFESAQLRTMIELEAFRVLSRGPKAEPRAAEAAQKMLEICTKYLGLSVISRIGYRTIRVLKFGSVEDAIEATKFVVSNRAVEPISDSAKIVSVNFGIKHETDVSGHFATLRAEEREFKATLPWEISNRVNLDLIKQLGKEYVVIIDSDYYTTGATDRDSLNLLEWAKQAERSIKKYWKEALQ